MKADVDWEHPSVPALLPCRLCGGQPESAEVASLPPRMSGPGAVVSATVRHWCGEPGVLAGGLSMVLTARDAKAAAEAWNKRMLKENPR